MVNLKTTTSILNNLRGYHHKLSILAGYSEEEFLKDFTKVESAKHLLQVSIEIQSPRQGTYGILQKFEACFALGIQSCWLIEPTTRVVHVYVDPTERTTFTTGNVIDQKLNIEIPVADIFE